ncbi:MAG: aminoacyl-tRNA hydrolase [Nitrospirae bacterium]|nr:MAG: aminoacyl-tRNA hydrolase [Nitrospirota bacterium]
MHRDTSSDLVITDSVAIPQRELRFSFSRSAGPGGQHVNKASTRVTLQFDVRRSPSLTDSQKQRIAEYVGHRLTRDGVLQLHAQRYRSQQANREELIQRFVTLLREALTPPRPRVPTRMSPAAKARRLAEKKRRALVKRQRAALRRSDED